MWVSGACVCKLCVSKLCVGKLCVSKLCVGKLCVGKLCVDKWCVARGGSDWRQQVGDSSRKKENAHRVNVIGSFMFYLRQLLI